MLESHPEAKIHLIFLAISTYLYQKKIEKSAKYV